MCSCLYTGLVIQGLLTLALIVYCFDSGEMQ